MAHLVPAPSPRARSPVGQTTADPTTAGPTTTAPLGPSCSGKTTFDRALAGLTTPSRGEIRLDGRPLPRRIDPRTPPQRHSS
ncbi:ATP-binding cassette domain-containing protein [Streptomyces antimycoticus]